MAKQKNLTLLQLDVRFWKRVYEWAIVTSREPLAYAFASPGGRALLLPWRQESVILVTDLMTTSFRVRIVNTFTKAVDQDVRFPMTLSPPQTIKSHFLAPPFLCFQCGLEGKKGEKDDVFPTWNVETGEKVAEFRFDTRSIKSKIIRREPHILAVPGEAVPHFYYLSTTKIEGNITSILFRSGKAGFISVLQSRFEFFSGSHLCSARWLGKEAMDLVTITNILSGEKEFEFAVPRGLRVSQFQWPYVLITAHEKTDEDGYLVAGTAGYHKVHDVRALKTGQMPHIWISPRPKQDLKMAFLGGGYVMESSLKESAIYPLSTGGDAHPPVFGGGKSIAFTTGEWENAPSEKDAMGRYYINADPNDRFIVMFGPHAQDLLGPPETPLPTELTLMSRNIRKPLRPFLASARPE
jgi:hypothetical protein